MEKFEFTTSDGVTIAGIKNNPPDATRRILCLHMMPATKESYEPLLHQLESLGWLGYAIDFRGHGESTENDVLDYKQFQENEHQKYLLDAQETLNFIKAPVDAVIGASIGANVGAIMQSHNQLSKSILLSPGIDYWGIQPQPAIEKFSDKQFTYFIATTEDNRKAGRASDMAQQLYNAAPTPHKFIDIYDGAEHGTDIIAHHPNRIKRMLDFLNH